MVKNKKVVEKIVELRNYRSGLKIAVGKKNTQNSTKTKKFGLFHMGRVFITDLNLSNKFSAETHIFLHRFVISRSFL